MWPFLFLACQPAGDDGSQPTGSGDPTETLPATTDSAETDPTDTATTPTTDSTPTDDTGTPTDDTGTTPPDIARWTFLVFINGDNNLETYVTHDLNELESAAAGEGVNVVVQADRIAGYDSTDGDWTGTRRYFINADDDLETVTSPVLEDLGELDMGDPAVLSDFLLWAAETYPAERTVLFLWDHGDSWSLTGEAPPPPSISSDDTSESYMSIAQGELHAGLAPYVEAYGKLDLIGFDACLMASWEVAHTLQDQADYMLASEVSVGAEGYRYQPAIDLLRREETATTEELAVQMVTDMVAEGTEWGETAVDLRGVARLSVAIDALAGLALEDPEASELLWTCRGNADGCYPGWEQWYLDIGDLTTEVQTQVGEGPLVEAAAEVRDALDATVLEVQGAALYSFITGLTIFADTSDPMALRSYGHGTWAEDTRWDDWLLTQVEE